MKKKSSKNYPAIPDLPPPPNDCIGWPWFPDPTWKPDFPLDGVNWPRVTIVTPSYNQGNYLEETIRSVLLQGYPDLEYFIMDGGSTDTSVNIIRKYEPWITSWVSEKDRGQSHAINKGFKLSSGEWMGWLNSDDCYAPYGLFHLLNSALSANANFIISSSVHFDSQGYSIPVSTRREPNLLACSPEHLRLVDFIDQPASLWTQELYEQCGHLREDMHYAFDWDFFIRVSSIARPALCKEVTAVYRFHDSHKTGSGGLKRLYEIIQIYKTYLPAPFQERFLRFLPIISVLLRFSMANRKKRGLNKFLSRAVLFLINRTGLLQLFGLPNQVWDMLGIYRFGKRFRKSAHSVVNFKYAKTPAFNVAEVLAQFPLFIEQNKS